MTEPTFPLADSLHQAIVRIVPVAAAILALSACASLTGTLGQDPAGYEYRKGESYVRIQQIEAGAPDNSHPFAISVEALTRALASVEVEGGGTITKIPMFTEEELKEIAPPLAAALAKAGPKEDIRFAVTGKRGLLGSLASSSITTGLLFVRDRELNLIFGLVQELYEDEEVKMEMRTVPPASRFYRGPRVGRVWKLVPKSGRLVDERSDWVALDVSAPASPAAPAAGGADSRFQEIQTRLDVIKRLKESGSITEEEYNERRRAILQGL
jgi:hypothetical protein